jgi:hypothetical protein
LILVTFSIFSLIAAMVRQSVMALGQPDLGTVRTRTLLDAEQHRGDAREIGLEGQHQQIHHQRACSPKSLGTLEEGAG